MKNLEKKIPSKSVKFILYKNDEDLSNAYIYSAEEISDNLAYFSLFTSPSENKEITNKLELVSKTKHSQNIVVKPTLVKNHRTNDLNIIFQDLDNELILTNLNGNKIWSKKFESSIISDIYQIDMYKNGRLQFVFLTYEYLYIVDVKGNIVKKPLIRKIRLKNICLFLIMIKIKITDWLFRREKLYLCMTQNSVLLKVIRQLDQKRQLLTKWII